MIWVALIFCWLRSPQKGNVIGIYQICWNCWIFSCALKKSLHMWKSVTHANLKFKWKILLCAFWTSPLQLHKNAFKRHPETYCKCIQHAIFIYSFSNISFNLFNFINPFDSIIFFNWSDTIYLFLDSAVGWMVMGCRKEMR